MCSQVFTKSSVGGVRSWRILARVSGAEQTWGFQYNAFLWQFPFVSAILFQAEEYALRALHLAKIEELSAQEQNTIQDLLNLVSVEEAQPIT